MADQKFYYRCTLNPTAPLLVLDRVLEAASIKDMKNHPDYERVNEFGEVIPQEDEDEGTIPFQGSLGRK